MTIWKPHSLWQPALGSSWPGQKRPRSGLPRLPICHCDKVGLESRRGTDCWLSTVGVLISAAIVSIGMTRILGWPLGASLIFGILIAATDPVSVIALLKDLGIAGRLRLLVESESLFNDGVAAVLFGLALPYAQNHSGMDLSSWYLLVSVSGGGVATGIVVAVAALLVAGRTRDHLVETAVTTVAAYGAFLLADDLHVSGVLATVSAGLVFGTIGLRAGGRRLGLSRQGQAFVLDLWEFLAFIANSVVFLLIGVQHLTHAFPGCWIRRPRSLDSAGAGWPGGHSLSPRYAIAVLPLGHPDARAACTVVGRIARRTGAGARFVATRHVSNSRCTS